MSFRQHADFDVQRTHGDVVAAIDTRLALDHAGAHHTLLKRCERAFHVILAELAFRFLFAFGRPDVLAARQAERCAKWEWSSEFLAKARPDKAGVGNYGAGDYFDDGLTVLERNQIASGKESFLTGGAKAAYRARTGQF